MSRFVCLICLSVLLFSPHFAHARFTVSLHHRPVTKAIYTITLLDGSSIVGTRYRLKKKRYVELMDHIGIILIPLSYIKRIQYKIPLPHDFAKLSRLQLSEPCKDSNLHQRLYYKDYKGHFQTMGLSMFFSFYGYSFLLWMTSALGSGITGNTDTEAMFTIPLVGPIFAFATMKGNNSDRTFMFLLGLWVAGGQIAGASFWLHGLFKKKQPYISKTHRPRSLSRSNFHPIPPSKALFTLGTASGQGSVTINHNP